MLYALRRHLAERDIGLLWLLLFRWLAIVVAVIETVLIGAAPSAPALIAVIALYTLALTLLGLRPASDAHRILRAPWLVGGDVAGLLLLNIATGFYPDDSMPGCVYAGGIASTHYPKGAKQ